MLDVLLTYLFLCLSAFGAGVVNTLAGGGTLLTFPALTRVIDLVAANVTSTVALVPGSLAGAWGLRREMKGTGPWLALLLGPSLLGGLAGALLLTRLDPGYFAIVVPWLLLTAALLFWLQPTLSKHLQTQEKKGLPSIPIRIAVVFFQFLVGIYGGYFGAGIGILMLSALSLMGLGDIHCMNAVKNILAAAINGISVVVFIWDGQIAWNYALVMAAAAILGGVAGATVGKRIPKVVIRWLVIAIGLGLGLYYLTRQLVPPESAAAAGLGRSPLIRSTPS
jgi:uncharacterized membrane protein YfcA